MKPLCAIKPKNENKLFSQSFRQVQKKSNLLLLSSSSSSNILDNYKEQLSERAKLNYSPKQISFNKTTSNGVSPIVKKMYLTYLNQQRQSIREPKPRPQFQRNFYCIPSDSLLQFPKNIGVFDAKCQALSLLRTKPNNSPITNKTININSNNPVEIFNKELFAFHQIVNKLNETDYSRIAKKLTKQRHGNSNSLNNSMKLHSLLIHNYYFENVIAYFQREIDYRNQLNQQMSQDDVYRLIQEEFNRIKTNLIKKNKIKYIDEPFNNESNKRRLLFLEAMNIKKTQEKSVIAKKESPKYSTYYQSLYERLHKKSAEKIDHEQELKVKEKGNEDNEVNQFQYEKTSVDDNSVLIQPTKNEKMKELLMSNETKEDKTEVDDRNEGIRPKSLFINAETQTRKGLKDELALQIKENNSKRMLKKKKKMKTGNNQSKKNENEVTKDKIIKIKMIEDTKNENNKVIPHIANDQDHTNSHHNNNKDKDNEHEDEDEDDNENDIKVNQFKSEPLFISLFQNKKPKKSHSTKKQTSNIFSLQSDELVTPKLRDNNDEDDEREKEANPKQEKTKVIPKEKGIKPTINNDKTTSNNITTNPHSLQSKKNNIRSKPKAKAKRLHKRNKTEVTEKKQNRNQGHSSAITKNIIEEPESGSSSQCSLNELLLDKKQMKVVDNSHKDNNTISTIVKTDNNNNIKRSLTNTDTNNHERVLPNNDTQLNTIRSKDSSSVRNNDQRLNKASSNELNSDYFNVKLSNRNNNQSEMKNSVNEEFNSHQMIERNKIKSNKETTRNRIKSKIILADMKSATKEEESNKEFLDYKNKMTKEFNLDNNITISTMNNAYQTIDSSRASANEFIKSLKHLTYQTYYSPSAYSLTNTNNKELKNKYSNPPQKVFQFIRPEVNSVLKTERDTAKKYKRKAKYLNNTPPKQREVNEDAMIRSLFTLEDTHSHHKSKYGKPKLINTNANANADVNPDRDTEDKDQGIAKNDFINKRNQKKNHISLDTHSNINTLFDNISALKSLSPENFSVQLSEQIDQQINLTNYAIQRNQENRLNDFIFTLRECKKKKYLPVRGKSKELRYVSPIHFRTFYKE